MQENDKLNPDELSSPKLATTPVDPTALEQEEKIMEGVENVVEEINAEDLDKKTYYKVSPTLYIKSAEIEEGEEEKLDDEGNPIELFKILNPETGVVETRELTDEEKKELFIAELKKSKQTFRSIKNPTKVVGRSTVVNSLGNERQIKEKEIQTNVTVNKYGSAYKQKRKRKNKMAKASRKANR